MIFRYSYHTRISTFQSRNPLFLRYKRFDNFGPKVCDLTYYTLYEQLEITKREYPIVLNELYSYTLFSECFLIL